MSLSSKLAVPDLDSQSLCWKPVQKCIPGPDSKWRHWLLDQGSLTARLIRFSRDNFSVQLVDEGWYQHSSPSLVRLLGNRLASQRLWSRKVMLQGYGRPWVMAHTLVPHYSLHSPLQQVKSLATKPLGAFLFSHPQLTRSSLQLSPMKLESASSAPLFHWGRCSTFHLFDRPILVAEYFLPELLASTSE